MKHKRLYFSARPVAVFAALCVAFAGAFARTAYLQRGKYAAAGAQSAIRYIGIAVSRGYIYDKNLAPLVNTEKHNVAAAILTPETRALLPAEQTEPLGKNGLCVTFQTSRPVKKTPLTLNVQTVTRYGGRLLCPHIVGYTDAGGSGVCGIEKAFDRILAEAAGRVGVSYTVNALGAAIPGAGLSLRDQNYNSAAGVVLTIDAKAQAVVEAALAASDIEKGAAVVLEAQTGAVSAIASVPAFNVHNLALSLNDPDLPFLNRALEAYPVGSVFKPFVAAAALEHGVACPADYECAGAADVSGVVFRCFNGVSHGQTDLCSAVSKSCNCYFIELGRRTGAAALLETASAFGFGREIRLTGTLAGASGGLPSEAALSAPAALANFSFGQGELLASPLQLAAAYAALANGGTYHAPYIAKALVDENQTEYAYYKNETVYAAVSPDTCAEINGALRLNMVEGTGRNGASVLFSAAGKTATAQTGSYLPDGAERLCTWFCGWFPYEAPRYAVVVFNEEGARASADCAPVFRAITEGLYRAGL